MIRSGLLSLGVLLAVGLLPQGKQDLFEKAYLDARSLNDRKLQVKAVKTYPDETLYYFRGKCDLHTLRNDAEAGKMADELIEVWKEAWNSELLKKIQHHRAGLDMADVQRIEKLVMQERQAWGTFEAAKVSKKDQEFRLAAEGMQKIAEALEEVGEKLEAAKAWLLLVNILEATPNRTPAETELQVRAIGLYLQLHKDWDWTRSTDYAVNSEWARGLRERVKNPTAGKDEGAGGKGSPAGGPSDAAGASPDSLLAFAPGSKWENKDLDYSVEKKLEDGISLYASSSPLYWVGASLVDVKDTELELFKDGKMVLKRGGATKFLNVVGGKDREIKLGGKSKPTELWYERADDKGKKEEINYAMWLWTGGNQEPWCGTTLNLQPQWRPTTPEQNFANIYWRSASVFTADIEGVPITLHDESANGVFGEKPGSVALNDIRLGEGIDKPIGHPMLDSMHVGGGPLVPFSSFIKVKDHWYTVKAVRNNEQLRYRLIDPAKAQTGHILVKWSGPAAAKPKHLVAVETSGIWSEAAFDLISGAGPKGAEVLAGTYEILYGRVWGGRAPQNLDAVVLKGESKPIEVKAGETVTVEIGAPFGIEFVPERSGKTVGANTSKMWVRDRFGLRWTCLAAEILEPQLMVAKDAKGAGAKVLGEWKRLEGQELDDVAKNYSGTSAIALAMFAIDKKTFKLDLKAPSPLPDPFFVGIGQKKHKLLGELKPIWK